jgi:hypothetical protein
MMGQQQFAYKLTCALAATFMVLATGAGSRVEESLRSPDLQAGSGPQVRPAATAEKLPSRTEEDPGLSEWMTLPAVSDPAYWSSFDFSIGANVRAGTSFDRNNAPSSSAAATPTDQLRLGSSYLGIQIEKNVQVLESLRRIDCPTDDECAEYSGLPKSRQPKASARNLRPPFIGLSITRPVE